MGKRAFSPRNNMRGSPLRLNARHPTAAHRRGRNLGEVRLRCPRAPRLLGFPPSTGERERYEWPYRGCSGANADFYFAQVRPDAAETSPLWLGHLLQDKLEVPRRWAVQRPTFITKKEKVPTMEDEGTSQEKRFAWSNRDPTQSHVKHVSRLTTFPKANKGKYDTWRSKH